MTISRVPQIIVGLTPQGTLKIELPGSGGVRRVIEMKTEEAGRTLLRILEAQARDEAEIGEDGAPTAAQLEHWERHETFPRDRCRFCIAEGRIGGSGEPRLKRSTLLMKRDGVEIKRIHVGCKGKEFISTAKTKELDL